MKKYIETELETIMSAATPEPKHTMKIKTSLPLIAALLLTGAVAGALLAGLYRPAPPSAATEIVQAAEEKDTKIDALLLYIGVARIRK